jgi:hypothetical protein
MCNGNPIIVIPLISCIIGFVVLASKRISNVHFHFFAVAFLKYPLYH